MQNVSNAKELESYRQRQARERTNTWLRTKPKKRRKYFPLVMVAIFTVAYMRARDAVAQNLEQYVPIETAFCQDVQLRCAVMIHKDAPLYFAVFSDEGKLLAITRLEKGKETTVWGILPLKKGEQRM